MYLMLYNPLDTREKGRKMYLRYETVTMMLIHTCANLIKMVQSGAF